MALPLPRVPDPVTDRALQLVGQQLALPVPQARVYNDANISITNNTLTALTFNNERFDNGGLHSTSSNTGRLTAPVAGLYLITVALRWASNATGIRFAGLRVNGATRIGGDDNKNAVTTDVTFHSITTVYQLADADYVEVLVFQNSGGALNIDSSAANTPEFAMVRLAGFTAQVFG